MKSYRKLLSLLLAMTLIMSLCPAGSAANEEEPETLPTVEEPVIVPEEDEPIFEPVELAPMPDVEVDSLDAEEEEAEEENTESAEFENSEMLFPGMPEGYVLSAEQTEAKQKLAENNVLAELDTAVPGVDYVDGEVYFLADTPEYAQEVAAAYGAELKEYSHGVATLALVGASVKETVAAGADTESNLPVVEANYIQEIVPVVDSADLCLSSFTAADVPVKGSWASWYEQTANPDPYMSDPSDSYYQYMHDIVNTYEAWGITKGAGVTVAVIDSGVSPNHEDLDANIAAYASVGDWGSEPNVSHGTHVAGIVAARMGNGKGGAGIAPEAKIYSIRVAEGGTIDEDNIIKAVNMAIDAKKGSYSSIKVINMSLGGAKYSYYYETAIKNAVNAGITVVAAMGNEGTNIKKYPAAFNIPGIIAVQSCTSAGTLSNFSNYGAWADVTAPGSLIMSTIPGGYKLLSGTSMASPVVAGVCALYLSKNPYASPTQVETAIRAATNKGIIDASMLFGSTVAAPTITTEYYGKELPYDSDVIIQSVDGAETLIYTLDGKTPSVKNGDVTGTVYNGSSITLAMNKENGFLPGTTVKISAAAINAYGIMSKVTTYSVKVGYADARSVEITTGDITVSNGKSVTMAALVFPAEAKQSVTWEIVDRSGCYETTIDSSKGILKVGKNDSGYVKIAASSVDGGVQSAQVTVRVETIAPAKKLTLSSTNVTLYRNSYGVSSPYQLTAEAFGADGSYLSGKGFTWVSSNTKVVTVDGDGLVSVEGDGSARITCTAADGSNVKASCSVKVVTGADELAMSGYSNVAPGAVATYTVTVLPKTVKDKTVIWSVSDASKASIDAKGKLTVKASSGSFKVRGETPLGVAAEKTVTITNSTTKVGIVIDDSFVGGGYKYGSNGCLTSATLFSVEPPAMSYYHNASIQLGNQGTVNSELEWTSSNTKVAVVDENGLVTAVAAGKAKLTCKALDSGKSSGSVNITVINPVSKVTVVSKQAFTYVTLVSGKSAANTVVLGDAFGKPTITKVNWSYEVSSMNNDGDLENTAAYTAFAKSNNLFKISSSGGLSSIKNAYRTLYNRYGSKTFIVSAVATTTDGTELSGRADYYLSSSQISKLYIYNDGTLYVGGDYELYKGETLQRTIWGLYDNGGKGSTNDWNVSSSNPDVAGAYKSGSTVIIVAGQKAGTARITLTSSDGSNKKLNCTVKVS